jgi:NAD(P)H-flavin reductase
MGYSHMRDEDPQSLNDDLVRTFTVSSPPALGEEEAEATEFEITIRKVGRVTGFLFKRDGGKKGLTVPVSGFGGEFVDDSTEEGKEKTVYIAGGVGITPFLALMGSKVNKGVTLFWTVREADLGLVADALSKIEGLGAALRLFITGVGAEGGLGGRVDKGEVLGRIVKDGGVVWERRIEKEDLVGEKGAKWMLCAGKPLRGRVLEWLEGETVVFEDFDY